MGNVEACTLFKNFQCLMCAIFFTQQDLKRGEKFKTYIIICTPHCTFLARIQQEGGEEAYVMQVSPKHMQQFIVHVKKNYMCTSVNHRSNLE